MIDHEEAARDARMQLLAGELMAMAPPWRRYGAWTPRLHGVYQDREAALDLLNDAAFDGITDIDVPRARALTKLERLWERQYEDAREDEAFNPHAARHDMERDL